ncbi:synaptonemal complex central element protein 1-like isoform X2 [Equus quagga]|uniref:synaptonemal complex central element protein 1-like isoform X2 n=1 Tax=Equus quagga TaxID=89248 RepID=UPI001EE387B3|nr:synaptonemal complex central element protein 1-like isoform X2 [Equus quagga]
MLQGAPVQASRWKMAGKVEPLKVEPLEVAEESEEAEGQTRSSKKTEDLLAMVKKLQKEGSLEPQIEDLIHRINELQQAKKKSSEELGEAQALWEALHRELDSLNGEKVHLEEVLSKKQEALRILQLHCQSKESEAQRLHVEEQLEDLMGQHKDLWEFHMLEQRLTWEIRALRSSKEQLLTEGETPALGRERGGGAWPAGVPGPAHDARPPAERLARAKLEQVARLLRSPPGVQGPPAMHDGLQAELEKVGGHVPAQTNGTAEGGAGHGEVEPWGGGEALGCPWRPSERDVWGAWRPGGSGKGTGAGQPPGRSGSPPRSLTPDFRRLAPSAPAPATRTTWRGRGAGPDTPSRPEGTPPPTPAGPHLPSRPAKK